MKEQLEQVLEVRKIEREYDGTVSVALDGDKKNIVRSVYLTLEKPEDVAKFPIGKKFNIALAAAVLVLVFAISAGAQAIPDAPSHVRTSQIVKHENAFLSPLKDPFFYGGIGNFAAAGIADVHNTTACEHTVPRSCEEAYKGNDRYAHLLPQLGLVALGQYGCSLMLYNHHRWRAACMLVSLPLAISHWNDATASYAPRL